MISPQDIDTNAIIGLASNFSLKSIMTLSLSTKLLTFILSLISAYKKSYWHFNIQEQLSIIFFKSMVMIYGKIFIKITVLNCKIILKIDDISSCKY